MAEWFRVNGQVAFSRPRTFRLQLKEKTWKGLVEHSIDGLRATELGSLGQTLMHEHVFVLSTEHMQNYGTDWWDEEARVADAIAKLNAVYARPGPRYAYCWATATTWTTSPSSP